jgi:hypothetical protein
MRVGRWEVIPAESVQLDDCTSQHALAQVGGLLKLYRIGAGER